MYNTQTTSDNMNKLEIKTEKENFNNRFPFDTIVDELEKLMMEGECPVNIARTLPLGLQ